MQVDGKTLLIGKDVWAQHGGVDVAVRGNRIAYTAHGDEPYVKVLNHFGRVLKLYTFEDGRWVDADTGVTAQPFDESQAGRLPETARPAKTAAKSTAKRAAKPAKSTAGRGDTKRGGKTAAKAGGKAEAKAGAKTSGNTSARRRPAKRRTG